MSLPPDPIRPANDDALKLARTLLRGARFAAISVLQPDTGHPFASRVLTGTDIDGVPVVLASMLTTHMKAMIADPRCALLVGEPGKGDPLAWPRLTVLCDAEQIPRDGESHDRIKARFLRRHPKAGLYIDFPDFAFFRLLPKSASLNGGFGKAHNFFGDDLIINSIVNNDLHNEELYFIAKLEGLGDRVADSLARYFFKEKTDNWYISGLDAEGIDLARKDVLHRFELGKSVRDTNGLIVEYANILMNMR